MDWRLDLVRSDGQILQRNRGWGEERNQGGCLCD